MPYAGDTLRIPCDSGGLNGSRNLELLSPKAMEEIRNMNLHEDGRGKRGGTSTIATTKRNLVANGDFETGDFTGWTVNSSAINTTVVRTDIYSCKLEAIGSVLDGAQTDVIEVNPFNDYGVDSWHRVLAYSSGTYKLKVYFYSDVAGTALISFEDIYSIAANTPATFQQGTKTLGPAASSPDITIPLNCLSIRLWQVGVDTTPTFEGYMDDISITHFTKITGLKQFISTDGIEHILTATAGGTYERGAAQAIKTGLTTRGDEVLVETDFTATVEKWIAIGNFSFGSGKLNYLYVDSSESKARLPKSEFETHIKPNTKYEFIYTVSGIAGTPGLMYITDSIAISNTLIESVNGTYRVQFRTNNDPGDFVLAPGSGWGGSDAWSVDDISLKEVIEAPVDISIYQKKAIFTNGYDVPQVYRGLKYITPAPSVVVGHAGEGAGNLDNDTYSYALSYEDALGNRSKFTNISTVITVLDNTVDGQILISGIPFLPPEAVKTKIYRTEGGGSTYKFLTNITDPYTTTFIDNVADGSLGTAISQSQEFTTDGSSYDLGIEGILPPTALSAELAGADAVTAQLAGAGTVTAGDHSWVIVFVTGAGVHTVAGSKSNVVTVPGGGNDVTLSNVPIGPEGTVRREIFRTVAGDTGNYYEVGAIIDNTTTTFIDSVADANLGSNVITNGILTGGSSWIFENDFSSVSNLARYVHSSGNGNLIQSTADFALVPERNHKYELEYQVVANSAPGNVDTFQLPADKFTEDAVTLVSSVGVHTIIITSKPSGSLSLTMALTSSAGVTVDIDNISLKEIAQGGVSIGSGVYSYKVTYSNVHGETTGSIISNTVTADSLNGEISLTDIPIGPVGVIARNLYRTDANGSSYTLAVTIGDNTTTTYTDRIVDANLGAAIPTTNTAAARPSDWIGSNQPKYALEHAAGNTEGLILFGLPNNPDTIYIVTDGTFDFSDANVLLFTIESSNRVELTGGVEYGVNPLLFSENQAWLVDKSDVDITNWTYIKAPWAGGVANNRLLVKTDNDVFAMMKDGDIYSIATSEKFGDYRKASITKPANIDRWIRDNINLDRVEDFHGIYDPILRCIKWFMVRTGETQVGSALTFFVDKPVDEAWVVHDDEDNVDNSGYTASVSTLHYAPGTGTTTVYTGDYISQVWGLEQSAKNDNSNGYRAGIKIIQQTAGNQRNDKNWPRGRVLLGTSDTVSMNAWVDNVAVETLTELLNDTPFNNSADFWSDSGDLVIASNKAAYAHSSGAGSFFQTAAQMVNDPTDYAGLSGRFTGTLANVAGNPTLQLDAVGGPGLVPVAITVPVANGDFSEDFTFDASPVRFQVSSTSDSGDDVYDLTFPSISVVDKPLVDSDGKFKIGKIGRIFQAEFYNDIVDEDLFIKEIQIDFNVLGSY